MKRVVGAALLTGMACAGVASAQEFRGAELSAEVLSFAEDDDIVGQTTYRGSVEAGVLGAFGVAADLSYYDVGDGARNVTLHGLYDGLGFATLGAFYSRDSDEDFAADGFGIEALSDLGPLGVEGYLGVVDDDRTYRILGLDGTYAISDAISVTGTGALVNFDGGTASRISVGGEYRFRNGPAVYGEIGRANGDEGDGSPTDGETFIGLGARIAIGSNDGTSFAPRGLSESLFGF